MQRLVNPADHFLSNHCVRSRVIYTAMPHGGKASQVDKHRRGHQHDKAAMSVKKFAMKKKPCCATLPSRSKAIPVSSVVSKVASITRVFMLIYCDCYRFLECIIIKVAITSFVYRRQVLTTVVAPAPIRLSPFLLPKPGGLADEGQPDEPEEHTQEGQNYFEGQNCRPS